MNQGIDRQLLQDIVQVMAVDEADPATDPVLACEVKLYQTAGLLKLLSKAVLCDRDRDRQLQATIHGYAELLDIAQVLLQDAARRLHGIKGNFVFPAATGDDG